MPTKALSWMKSLNCRSRAKPDCCALTRISVRGHRLEENHQGGRRLLAATNRNLTDAVREGRFRMDLYDRLLVVPIEVPPVRRRREDIPDLVDHFVRRYARQFGRPIEESPLHHAAVDADDRPGKIRELENVRLAPWHSAKAACSTFRSSPPRGERREASRTPSAGILKIRWPRTARS